jgi:hypothetical protein
MTKDSMSEIQAIDEARQLLATIKSPVKAAAIARRVLDLLDVIEQANRKAEGMPRPTRRGAKRVVYMVEKTEVGQNLAEHRPGSTSSPFRCPKPLYDAVVKVLAGAKRPLGTDDIVSGVERLVGYRPGEHQYRVALRFFTTVEPPLLVRSRAKYSPANTSFSENAARLWTTLRTA